MNDDDFGQQGWDDVASLDAQDVDRAEVARDDELLDLLGSGELTDSDDPLVALLADWRAETDAAAMPPLPSAEEIEVAMASNVTQLRPRRVWTRRGDHHHGTRPALWQAVTGAAAVAAMIVGGLSVAAHSAMPGDPLWGVSKTIFSDRAGEVELVNDLSEYLAAADDAAREGDHSEAERLLEQVSQRLDEVTNAAERVELMKRRDAILRDLSRVTPTAVPSPAPAPDPGPAPAPQPGQATLVPGVPVPLPSNLIPPPAPGMPVIPLPMDGLGISTTLQIPVDTQRLQDFLAPTTGIPADTLNQETQTQTSPTRVTVTTQVPTTTAQSQPEGPAKDVAPSNSGKSTSPTN
ncbi:hypothetical protein NCCP2495_28770 [Dietzia sp. NCCP-2495]|uniref:hypothetical protein n=1 Tax=Dietzia sp. NCCP-2495 TaxID=2934675 RepID=UPI00222F2ACA|nr:hypothetical protein [Dietzia sp. NCCP-2495]GLB64997.1 hypothetical protein NCCP2495_28770 [Dietzia sp. NCCP-2495]